ncbi:uncharacterized protein LOC118466626 [Anopheles albimanus]|nr:uncharacterized protein LOC118466626 [Anopheles albimanus]
MKFAPSVLLTLAALLSVTYGQAVSDNGVTTEGISSSTAGTISLTAIRGNTDATSGTLATSTVMTTSGPGSTTKKRRRLISCIRRFGDRGGFRLTYRTTISDSNSANIQ